MALTLQNDFLAAIWHLLGGVGAMIFYSRFYVQWIASEREGRSVLPEVFWHMSTLGSLILLGYAIATRSPLGALGQCFNIIVYARNLLHIWRAKRVVAAWTNFVVHLFVFVVALGSVIFVVSIWRHEIHANQSIPPTVARQVWLWLGIGVTGQALFACRFLVQWIATESMGECTVPRLFWQLSVIATMLQSACFLQRGEWIFATGSLAVLFVYFRNLSLTNAQPMEAR